MPSLFVIRGRDQGQRFVLEGDELSIGRVAENAVQLHDTEVSRQHAQLQTAGDSFVLRDLRSSNGTYVNGEAIREHRLRTGDLVQLGRTQLLYTGSHNSVDETQGGGVDIVSPTDFEDGSRILHAMSPSEGSDLLSVPANQTQSPWLARAQSNLQLMYRTTLAVSQTLDIDQLLARIMDMIFEWVDADRGCIMLKDPVTGELRARVRRRRRGLGESTHTGDISTGSVVTDESDIFEPSASDSAAAADSVAMNADEKITISKTILDYVVDRGEGVLTSNAGDDSRWDPAMSIMQMGVREAICVPMQGRYELNGVIYIDTSITPKQMLKRRNANKFGEDHLKLMIAIAHQAALAVEDTSHYQAMVQAERLAAVGQTIATLSHHIKNILQGIRGGSYLIELGLGDHDKALAQDKTDMESAAKAVATVHKGWDIVEKNQERISSLVMDMLTYSKEREPEPKPSNLNSIVAEVIELMQARADEKKVSLAWQPTEVMPTLMFDPEAIHRAVTNIVTNAIDACVERDPARVDIATEVDEAKEAVRVTVQDTGVGIAKDKMATIFTAFVSDKGSDGTGLGLAVSQKIAEEHHGNVLVTSEPGVGSTFTFELPLTRPEEPKPSGEDANRKTYVDGPLHE